MAAIPLAMAEGEGGIPNGRILRSGPAEAVGGDDRFAAELDGRVRGEAVRPHVGDFIKADLRKHREGVFAAGDLMAVDLEVESQGALMLLDVFEGNASVQQVGEAGGGFGLEVEFGPLVGFPEQALIVISLTEEKGVVRAVNVEVVR